MTEVVARDEHGRATSRTAGWAGLVVLALGTVVAGVWGVTSPREGAAHGHGIGHETPHGRVAPIAGGFMRVEGVEEVGLKHAMPGMTVDTVPPGYRRLNVQVTLVAGAQPLRTDQDFVLSGKGASSRGPTRRQIATALVPAGTAVTGLLTFQVPERAVGLRLGVRGAAGSVALPPVGSRTDAHLGDAHG